MQSLHDGERWVHTPLRLSVFIEAPRAAIDGVLDKHANVRALVGNGWISLFQLDEDERAIYARRVGGGSVKRPRSSGRRRSHVSEHDDAAGGQVPSRGGGGGETGALLFVRSVADLLVRRVGGERTSFAPPHVWITQR